MEIKRSGSQSSIKGPSDWFTGTVRIDPLFQAAIRQGRRSKRHIRAGSAHGLAYPPLGSNSYRYGGLRLGAACLWYD